MIDLNKFKGLAMFSYIKIGILGFLSFFTINSYGVSNVITCDSPQSNLEIFICQDEDLSRLNSSYNNNLLMVEKFDIQVSSEVSKELNNELQKCNDKNCLLNVYTVENNNLTSAIEKYSKDQKTIAVEKSGVNTNKNSSLSLDIFDKFTLNDFSLLLNAYLLVVGFLYLLTKILSTKNFLTKTLFFVIGFPFVLIGWFVKLLNMRSGRDFDNSHSDVDYDDADQPARNNNSNRNSNSSSSTQNKEKIIIEYQGTGGGWFTIGSAPSDNSFQIAQSLKSYGNGIKNNPNFSGKIRARGADSGRVYDMNIM
jgi:uncharacterized protein